MNVNRCNDVSDDLLALASHHGDGEQLRARLKARIDQYRTEVKAESGTPTTEKNELLKLRAVVEAEIKELGEDDESQRELLQWAAEYLHTLTR
jgi:hypothetical protein